ncbi:M50 family metallopeptidase [Cellulomonas sp. P24]|uniref:M50 family metallopeptidase n=1 Tax=Cellulomonas sp. P24 TaxID=2885206 RepID=UPI00216B63D2|nr:M50 family metallopeptidase [Cellulomonas sp. P24]MCR6492953.1 M50 family metallopeptidase [Cellulomonas sp. P24]
MVAAELIGVVGPHLLSPVVPLWERASAVQPPPSGQVIAATAAVAFLLVAVPGLWARTRHAVTIVHEGAHATAAVLTGRRLTGIRLHSDTSGLTVSVGRPTGAGMVTTVLVGYIGPALLGLGSAALLRAGHAVGLLWLLLVALLVLIVQVRNWFGLWSMLVFGALIVAVTWWASAEVQVAFAYLVTWFLLIAAPRPVIELQRLRRRRRTSGSDADVLARLTHLPGLVWVGFFLVVDVGALGLGGWWLLGL